MTNKPKNVVQIGQTVLLNAPPLSNFVEVEGAIEAFIDLELAKYAIKRLNRGIELHKKHVSGLIRDQESAEVNQVRHPAAPVDLTSMQKTVKKTSTALEALLVAEVDPKSLAQLHKEHTGTLAVAQALLELGLESEDDAVLATAKRLKREIETFKTGQDRVAKGGHAGLDPEISKVLTEMWAILDEGYDILGILLRNQGITYDVIHANRPTQRPPVRVVLTTHDPATVNKGGRPPKSGGKAKGKGGGAANGGSAGSKTSGSTSAGAAGVVSGVANPTPVTPAKA
ncbi:MAG: hypothetical protein JST54_13450 [Deltaproteobacteria bacterium]|nr:hypothetical protein [Deltaproteobacteria bacterium]